MAAEGPDTEGLLRRAFQGDADARGALLDRYRRRLWQVIACRMDAHLASRLDPSDVVQDTFAVAVRRLDHYLRERPMPFYPWLRQLAVERLASAHRYHVDAQRRSVLREQARARGLPDGSAREWIDRLLDGGESPSAAPQRDELRARVRKALAELDEADREVLRLRYEEQLSAVEVGAALGVSEAAAKKRALRALRRLQRLLKDDPGGERP